MHQMVTSSAWHSLAADSWTVPVLSCRLRAAHFGICDHPGWAGAPQLWGFHAMFGGGSNGGGGGRGGSCSGSSKGLIDLLSSWLLKCLSLLLLLLNACSVAGGRMF